MKKLIGLLVTCVVVPALYGAAAYYIATHNVARASAHERGMRIAFLFALPVAAAGVVHWWDVWVKPLPKLGLHWAPMQPARFVGETLMVHGGIVVAALVVQLVAEQRQEFGQSRYDFAKAEAELKRLNGVLQDARMNYDRVTSEPDPGNFTGVVNDIARTSAGARVSSAAVDRDMLKAEIAEERKKAEDAKPNATFPSLVLVFGVIVTVITSPMQSRHYSGQPITTG